MSISSALTQFTRLKSLLLNLNSNSISEKGAALLSTSLS